jgi:chaperonin GroES
MIDVHTIERYGGRYNMKIKPLGNRVLLKPIEAEEKTKSGLYIPDSAKEKPLQAEVIAVGDGELIKVKVGQRVIYESYGGSEIKIDNEKHMLMDIKDILAIIE